MDRYGCKEKRKDISKLQVQAYCEKGWHIFIYTHTYMDLEIHSEKYTHNLRGVGIKGMAFSQDGCYPKVYKQ